MECSPLSSTSSSPHLQTLAKGLAEALLAGPWRSEDLFERGSLALGQPWRWLRPLVGRLLLEFGTRTRPKTARVVAWLLDDPGFARAQAKHPITLRGGLQPPPVMWTGEGGPASWPVPAIVTSGDLAHWLCLDPAALDWFADPFGRQRHVPPGPLRHYEQRWVAKRSGSVRLIEAPKSRLKAIQRRLLDEILTLIPPHEAAQGFRHGRSVRTYIAPHVGQRVVLKLDLRNFFPSISSARVLALFLLAGYPEPVARLLTGLCTTATPSEAWANHPRPGQGPEAWQDRRLYQQPHLPQGAPTSPALANLASFRLDARLLGLAASAGANYTRYADDLAFSGDRDFERSVDRFVIHVGAVAIEEGFAINTRKTRVMRLGVRQSVAGVVLNDRPNLARDEFDALKATLFNCVRQGPQTQNRAGLVDFRAHLAGRVAHVTMLNPVRGRQLRKLFDQISWNEHPVGNRSS